MASLDFAELKKSEGGISKAHESPIQAGIAQIMSELEYLSMDIGRLDDTTHTVQGRPNEASSDTEPDVAGFDDTWSPIQRQLFQIHETLKIQRSRIRRITEVIEL